MGRLRGIWLLFGLLTLSGCFGLWGGQFSAITGTVRIDATGPSDGAGAVQSAMARSYSVAPQSGPPAAPTVWAQAVDPGPVEVLVTYRSGVGSTEALALAESAGFTHVRSSKRGYHVLRDRWRRDESEVVAALYGLPHVARVEVNHKVQLMAPPLDPEYANQWALREINIEPAWEVVGQGEREVVVAIIDSGIHFGHPELGDETRWVEGRDFTGDAGDEGAPYPFDPTDTARAGSHGTMVAGIIGALTNNHFGMAGVVGEANIKLMPVRIFRGDDPSESVGQDRVAAAIDWAVENGADVINLSLGANLACSASGCPPPDIVLQKALDDAYAAGVTVVAAAGNHVLGGAGPVMAPANYPTTIAVGATARNRARAAYSGMGPELDVVAPGGGAGVGLQNAWPDCGSGVMSLHHVTDGPSCNNIGTSVATPHVSGIVALMLAAGADPDPENIRAILRLTAADIGPAGRDDQTGNGLVNAYGAVTAGVPVIFAADRAGDTLKVAGTTVRPEPSGVYRLSDIPEGTWNVYAWVDVDGDGFVSDDDYFAESGKVVARKGQTMVGIDLVLEPYQGDRLDVDH